MAPRTPLLDPSGYFSTSRNPFARGTGVFALHVVLDLIVAYLLVSFLFGRIDGLSPGERRQVESLVMSLLFFAAFVYVIAWLVVAAIMHYTSGGAKTDGTFADALGVAGWAYAPEIVALVPTALYGWQRLSALELDASNEQRLQAEIEALAAQQVDLVSVLILLVVTGWSVVILAKGVAETHDVSLDTAAIPAIVVGLGSILFALV